MRSELADNFNPDVEASHLGAIRVGDGGISVVSSTGQKSGNDVRDLTEKFISLFSSGN